MLESDAGSMQDRDARKHKTMVLDILVANVRSRFKLMAASCLTNGSKVFAPNLIYSILKT